MAGRESLVIYTVHLMLLYGNYGGPHWVDRVNRSYGFPEVIGVSLALAALMVVLAWVWNRIKAGPRWFTRTVEAAVAAGFAYVFFVGL